MGTTLKIISLIIIDDLSIEPKIPQAYRPIIILKIAAKIYAQIGAIEKKPPNFATMKPKIEKLIITPRANSEFDSRSAKTVSYKFTHL
ncbi:MAG: hypothetical protein GQ570_08320 [Helicobacteraceae bacterium]|nr:hypothetical protein [Helicobacteraceae bacterium]